MACAPVAGRRHQWKRFWCEGAKKKGPCPAGSLAALTGGCAIKMFTMNFFMANVREMVNTHLPVALKLINSAALVAIALSTLCAAGSLREMSGRSAAPAAVTEAN